ncbi:AbrB/MazE/SpoVT family DNA-binding domain-containing protein [Cellulomonas chitinilytica]|uniref:AbrB/MazE/SpoVT family DNA-binding domain-containing protein n=1 Tax=Cellulomonas chitinilytica TaxID=398759 RepID=UPI0023B3573D|nr:AbrB/MazE/SpoVT family DNA-binding domain-containing protein [Cellulomonas chitinilytica]
MGDRGRLVVPAELRQRAGLGEGSALIIIDTPSGLVVMTRDQARDHVRRQLEGADLVAQLLDDRRRAAAGEDAA